MTGACVVKKARVAQSPAMQTGPECFALVTLQVSQAGNSNRNEIPFESLFLDPAHRVLVLAHRHRQVLKCRIITKDGY